MVKYTPEFKLLVVQRYLEGAMGYRTLAEEFGIANFSLVQRWVGFFRAHGEQGLATIGGWERAYREGGIAALEPGPIGKSKVQPEQDKPEPAESADNRSREELLDELLHLRAEVAYLKKLEALVRSRAQVKAQPKAPQKKRK